MMHFWTEFRGWVLPAPWPPPPRVPPTAPESGPTAPEVPPGRLLVPGSTTVRLYGRKLLSARVVIFCTEVSRHLLANLTRKYFRPRKISKTCRSVPFEFPCLPRASSPPRGLPRRRGKPFQWRTGRLSTYQRIGYPASVTQSATTARIRHPSPPSMISGLSTRPR
jgi:hypothetical protein